MISIKRYLPAILLVLSGQLTVSAAELIAPVEDSSIESVSLRRKKTVRHLVVPATKSKLAKAKAKSSTKTKGNAKVTAATTATNSKHKTKGNKPSIGASHALSSRQLTIARSVYTGTFSCAFGIKVSITPDSRMAGRFVLGSGNKRYTLYPVPTTNGTVRLEDNGVGIVWLQLPSKSMLMSQKEGRRIADECVNYSQLQEKKAIQRSSRPVLSDKSKS